MAAPEKRSQKEIALTYGGSAPNFTNGRLDYFRRGHWFRRLRLALFIVAVGGSIGGVIAYSFFVGPGARERWNKDLQSRVSEAVKKGQKVAPPWNPEELFNTGAISENHSRLEGGCQACHWGSNPDVARLIGLGKVLDKQPTNDAGTFAMLGSAWKKEGTKGILDTYAGLTKLQQMDTACVACHVGFQQLPVSLHLPQTPQLRLAHRDVGFPFPVVDAGTCSSCHKEHVGRHRMADVSSETCAQCHAKTDDKGNVAILDILKDPHRASIVYPGGSQSDAGATVAQVGEGIARFLVWRAPGDTKGFSSLWNKPFRFYGPADPRDKNGPGYEGHPPFRYELPTARDPGRVKFGHMQHEQPKVMNLFNKEFEKESADLTGLPIREWINKDGSQNCLYCHENGPDGEYRQKMSFERHCQNCHRMDIVVPPLQVGNQTYPAPTRINIPHRDPEKVRAFLDQQSLLVELDRAALNTGFKDPTQRREYVVAAFTNLKNRGIENPLELLRRVFYTGDPAYESWRQSPTTNKALNACALCHADMLSPQTAKDYLDIARAPGMAPSGIAHRWANHGPFTHEPHKHMTCADCHANNEPVTDPRNIDPVTKKPALVADPSQPGKPMTYSVTSAHDSRISADILMPRQRLCAECHRPMPNEAAAVLAAAGGPTGAKQMQTQSPADKTKWQRATGGIKYECLDCHKFHAPAEALPFVEKLDKAATGAN
ncbi:MAG: hypothetical protein ABMA13_20800 [Chthoniobacteraceae bacterium]